MPDSTSSQPADTPAPPPSPPPTLPRTLHGSCHCGHITYTLTLALPIRPYLPLASRCNCRVCLKTGFTNFHLPEGRDAFELLTPESLQSEGVVECSGVSGVKGRVVKRWFCGRCGVTFCAGGSYVVSEEEGEGEGQGQGQGAGEAVGEEKAEIKSAREELRREEIVGKTEYADQSTAVDQKAEEFLSLTEGTPATNPESENDGNQDHPSKPSPPRVHQEHAGITTETEEGQVVHFFSVNIVTLDQPQEGLDLSVFKIEYWDGRNNNWQAGKKESPWSGGIV